MIQILDKHNCCGCSACVSICPQKCTTMAEDNEGFLYPSVNTSQCINCGLCEKVCPVINKSEKRTPLKAFAAHNKNEIIRRLSSSGGIFTFLAENVINDGGVVFGARFDDDFNVRHDYAETIEALAAFRGSKYLQSKMLDNYSVAKAFLEEGRKILFSGTPCQISGMNRYLRKRYNNLLTVDCICHGVPSPLVWKSYLNESGTTPTAVSFRDKKNGWKRYFVTVSGKDGKQLSTPAYEDKYIRVFLSDLCLRPSCYDCPAKGGRSCSDITLGDFWGIEHIDPAVDDDKGTSLVLVNTEKGETLFNSLDIEAKEEPYGEALKYNPSIAYSVDEPAARTKFFNVIAQSGFNAAYKATMVPPLSRRVIGKAKRIARRILGEKGKKIVRILREK